MSFYSGLCTEGKGRGEEREKSNQDEAQVERHGKKKSFFSSTGVSHSRRLALPAAGGNFKTSPRWRLATRSSSRCYYRRFKKPKRPDGSCVCVCERAISDANEKCFKNQRRQIERDAGQKGDGERRGREGATKILDERRVLHINANTTRRE